MLLYNYMKHLLPTTDSQTIKIIPRVYSTNVTIKLRDDSTNEEITILPSATISRNYVELTSVFTLLEGHFYDLKIYNGQGSIDEFDIIYRDKIFCTSQSTDQSNNEYYTINKDVYKEKSGNNDFIIL